MVGNGGDSIASLADSARLTEDEVKPNRLCNIDGSVEVGTDLRATTTTGKTAHVEVVIGEGIHSDPIAEKCTTGSLTCWVNTEQADFLAWVVSLDT